MKYNRYITTLPNENETTNEMINRIVNIFTKCLIDDIKHIDFTNNVSSININLEINPNTVVNYSITINYNIIDK